MQTLPVLAAAAAYGTGRRSHRRAGSRPRRASPSLGLPGKGIGVGVSTSTGAGVLCFANSLYTNPKPDQPSGDLSDDWLEGSIKPALTAAPTRRQARPDLRRVSAVGERTYGAAPTLVGEEASSFEVEDLYIGWRSGTSLGDLGENALDFTVGRTQYKLGHGMLLWDGASEGGTRGGYWTNARKAFEFAAIGRFKPGAHTVEGFYLDRDELPEADSGSKLWGVNYEYAFGEDTTLGATYMKLVRRSRLSAGARRARRLQCARLHGAVPELRRCPSSRVRAGGQRRRARLDGVERARGATSSRCGWKPKLSYRYAFFEGDDPATRRTKPSTACSRASTTGARGGRARSRASTSSRTRT